MTDLWDTVLKQAEQQRAKGMSKYGKPVTADAAVDWLQHAIEEQLDSAVYMQAAKQVIIDLLQELQAASDLQNRVATAADDYEDRLKEANSAIEKLAEANTQLNKECQDWLKLYSGESTALAESRKECSELLKRVKALEVDLQAADSIAEDNATKWAGCEAALVDLQKRYDQQAKQRQAEEESWAAVAKRLRTEAETATKKRLKVEADLVEERRMNPLCFWSGVALASGAAALLWTLF